MRAQDAVRWLTAAGALLLGACNDWAPTPPPTAGNVPWTLPAQPAATLDQGWNAELAARFHFTAQGSRLIPRAWLSALQRADIEGFFAAPANLARYGLLFAEDAGTGLN